MYLGLAILMGTGWLRLSYSETNIQNVLNSLFFGSAFMSFMVRTYKILLTIGRGLYPSFPRRSSSNGARKGQRTLWANLFPHRQFSHWPSLSL